MIIARIDVKIMNKIPKCCRACPFVHHHKYYSDMCLFTKTYFGYATKEDNFDEETQRLPNCPLVEVKEGLNETIRRL